MNKEKIACPFCNSTETEMIALFGQQMMTSQYYCNNCRTVFEAVKWNATPDSQRERAEDQSEIGNLKSEI